MESPRPESRLTLSADKSNSKVSHVKENVGDDLQGGVHLGDSKAMEGMPGIFKLHENGSTLKTTSEQVFEATNKITDEDVEIYNDQKMNDKEEDNSKAAKKRGRKLKKKTEKRTAFDGRKVIFVTEFTQTDWEWKDKAEKTGKSAVLPTSSDNVSVTSSRTAAPELTIAKSDSRQSLDRPQSETEVRQSTKTVTDLTPLYFVPDDEFGIPLAEMSSDSDSTEGDYYHEPKNYQHHLPSVGPPQILRYIPESEIQQNTEKEIRNLQMSAFDLHGIRAGMFSGVCEFCGVNVKPFPTLDQQLSQPPELLYCCQEYRDFVEFAMNASARLEEDVLRATQQINVKVHAHHGSIQERQLAKEKAVQRMRERAQQRKEQEASRAQAALNQSDAVTTGTANVGTANAGTAVTGTAATGTAAVMGTTSGGISENPTEDTFQLKDIDSRDDGKSPRNRSDAIDGPYIKVDVREDDRIKKEDGEVNVERRDKEEFVGTKILMDGKKGAVVGIQKKRVRKTGLGKGPKIGEGSKLGDKESQFGDMESQSGERESQSGDRESLFGRIKGQIGVAGQRSKRFSFGVVPGFAASFSSFLPFNVEATRQMKTINYQLSSQRCLEEGWTLRPPSPLETDDLDIFIPEPLHPAMIATGKLQDRPLIEKFYPDGSKFLTIFPDGTGNVFYPSGRLSILITSISLGQNTYIVQDDSAQPAVLAIFEPSGCGWCSFSNGKVRLTFDQISGIELDYAGGRKKSWNWKDQETHVHVPPFQPIVFGLNSRLGIRFMAQENIALTLTGGKRSCRFNVGSRLKAVPSEGITPKVVEDHQLVISEHKVKTETIFNKIANFLKFPKSPKVDYILPPLSVSSRKQKVDKMKQASASSPNNRQPHQVKQTKLPPLNSSAVSVN